MKLEDCIFCKIANGEIPSNTVYEDDLFRVILDISPAAKGHTLILTKDHYANIMEIDEQVAAKALVLAKKIATAVKKATNADGVNILQNNGEAAGQTVFHFHMHIIPRFNDDQVGLTWKQLSLEDSEFIKIKESIIKEIA